MNGVRPAWLVARRELRERVRSKALWTGMVIMLIVVVAAVVVPAALGDREMSRDVGFAGRTSQELPQAVTDQGGELGITVGVHRYDDVPAGEAAMRDKQIDVLVVDGRQLTWRGEQEERLRAVLTGAIQLVTVQQRAAAAGITQEQLTAVAAPVAIENRELGIAAGRSQDDEVAASVMSLVLLAALATYGQLVLTGVVQEKSSRVVEVLLARMSARDLLAGKVAGIGLLGIGQLAVTAAAALAATVVFDPVDVPAVSGAVLAWGIVWFALGYTMYAMAYGAMGSLASRVEDASAVAAPATVLLILGYWTSLLAVSDDPEGPWATAVSLFPATAPYAMPARTALGVTAWWEPLLAVTLALAAIAGLVVLAGRVYTGAILHTGATLKLREAWSRRALVVPAHAGSQRAHQQRDNVATGGRRTRTGASAAAAIGLAAVTLLFTKDAVMAVAAGAAGYAVTSHLARARLRH
jgi:ABC-2 type transport system permease protein